MKKVAYITNAPPQSGMGRPAQEIGQRLAKNRFALDRFFIDGTRGQLQKNEALVASLSPLPGPLAAKPVQWWRLAKSLPKDGYDLWHLTNQSLAFITRQPAIVTVYDLIELLDPQKSFSGTTYRYLYRGLPKAQHIICISEYTKKTLQETYNIPDKKITIIPLAVNQHFRRLPNAKQSVAYQEFLSKQKIKPEQKIVLYVGSEHPRKNLDTLIAAFAKVRRAHPNTILIKVGDPGLRSGRAALLAALDQHSLASSTRLIGKMGDDQLQLLYSIADVFVFPSTFEGFGLPPLEAMACGCPVIASNQTSVPEVVGNAGILLDPADTQAFADNISRVLQNQKLAQSLSQQGQRRAEEFSWQKVAEQTAAVYSRVLSE